MTTTSTAYSGLTFGVPLPLERKAAGDGWEVAGYASTWDRDLGDDVVERGAFAASLRSGGKVRFLYQHDAAQVLGRPLELYEDGTGLFGRFRISKTQLGQDVRTLLTDGSLDSFSIGFVPRDWTIDQQAQVRHLKAVELLEVSVVALPMQPRATVTSVKGTAAAPRSPLVAQLEAAVGRRRRHAFVASLSDRELGGYIQVLRYRAELLSRGAR